MAPTPEQSEALSHAISQVHLSLQKAALEVSKIKGDPISEERFRLANLESNTPEGKQRELELGQKLRETAAIATRTYVDLYSETLGLGNIGS